MPDSLSFKPALVNHFLRLFFLFVQKPAIFTFYLLHSRNICQSFGFCQLSFINWLTTGINNLPVFNRLLSPNNCSEKINIFNCFVLFLKPHSFIFLRFSPMKAHSSPKNHWYFVLNLKLTKFPDFSIALECKAALLVCTWPCEDGRPNDRGQSKLREVRWTTILWLWNYYLFYRTSFQSSRM